MTAARILRVLLVAGVFGLCAEGQSVPRSAERVPPVAVLKGTVRSQQQWGLPGFGESPKVDQKIRIFVLRLRQPVTAKELSLIPDEHPGKRYTEIQLSYDENAFPSCKRLLTESVGRHITVSGELAYAVNPTDYLPIGMTVRLIQRP